MPAEFLCDVVRRPAARRSRTWSVVPLSIAVHAAGALAFFIIPLAAEEPPPPPRRAAQLLNVMEARPLPPPPPLRTSQPLAARANPHAAPLVAPASIENERPVEPVDPSTVSSSGAIGTIDGVPGGIALLEALPAPIVAPPPPPRQLFRPGGEIRVPTKIHHVPPVYPPIALGSNVQGVVILEATISETGAIENVRVLRSHPLLERAAVDAVRQWKYTPTRLNGQPVPVIVTVTVTFTIER